MKNLFNFGGQAKEQEQMQDLQGNYDFVETPEIFREFKEPSGPAEETNLLNLHLDKAAEEAPKGMRIVSSSPRSSFSVSFKGGSGDEIDVGEYEPLEMDLSDAEAGGHPDADLGEYEPLEMDLSGQEGYTSGMEDTAGTEDAGYGGMEGMDMNVMELDLNGDGIADALGMDLDGNGIMDSIAVNLSGDGRVDTVFSDLDGDGVYETVRQDLDGDGVEDVMHMDLDGDGIADITIEL